VIGLDTNVLVRYLAQDDPVQSLKATELIERRLSEGNPGFLSVVAMVETAWVLDRAYGRADRQIAAAIERTLQADVLVVENEQEVFAAMIALREGHGSFVDALIGGLGGRAGCTRTLTFDQRASRLPGFELLW
jgi:predicted nucleic-acid-binding protein